MVISNNESINEELSLILNSDKINEDLDYISNFKIKCYKRIKNNGTKVGTKIQAHQEIVGFGTMFVSLSDIIEGFFELFFDDLLLNYFVIQLLKNKEQVFREEESWR
ncbi:hypothetical protein DMUE_4998 [Dictyocoela muelleri]|nr:hypothetical protein DMUE_4998 [Dictyocoela muelleri]